MRPEQSRAGGVLSQEYIEKQGCRVATGVWPSDVLRTRSNAGRTAVLSLEPARLTDLDQRKLDPKPFAWTANAELIQGKA